MIEKNLFQIFEMPQSLRNPLLPFHPLEVIAGESDTPKIVVSYDHRTAWRVVDAPRPTKSDYTHVTPWILPGMGEVPVEAAFNAAGIEEALGTDGAYHHIAPAPLQEECKRLFGDELNKFHPLLRALHKNLKVPVPGKVVSENRYGDSFIVFDRPLDRQIQGALDVYNSWRKKPPTYMVRGLGESRNCQQFVNAVLRGAGIAVPRLWEKQPWPGLYARFLEWHSAGRLMRRGDRLGQPRAVTQRMQAAMRSAPAVL
ncbi:MAG: hypothetical protein P4M15_03430 [Alphaproteobacteria bacterium]|nr:hypothetical protein [Alphaproteobacteria bacterium]